MKRLLLCTDGSVFAHSSYQYAEWLSTRLTATVDVLYVTDERSQGTIETSNFSGSIGIDASDVLLNQLVKLEHQKAKLNYQRGKGLNRDTCKIVPLTLADMKFRDFEER